MMVSKLAFCLFSLLIIQFFAESYGNCVNRGYLPKNVKPSLISVRGRGHLYSPGYDKKLYPNAIECWYQLTAPKGYHVRLSFNDLEIEATDACAADSLYIYDFDRSGKGILVAIQCGDHVPYDYVSKSQAVQLVFRSDDFGQRRGFNITYSAQIQDGVCSSVEIQCRNRKCVKHAFMCDGSDDCGDGTDEENCGFPQSKSTCGKPDIDPKIYGSPDRIVGGQEAVPGSWPWMADLQMKLIEPNGHMCGGSLINDQWVLTAAHCFKDVRQPSSWRIHLGNHKKFHKHPHEQIRYIERFVIYDDIPLSKFQSDGKFDMVNDMALIKLNAPVKFTKYVKPVCLPNSDMSLDITSECFATGWGVTRGTGSSDSLKQAYHPVQPDAWCRRLVGSQFDNSTMICAGSMAPKNGVCHGDSGGPLVCLENKTWKIAGVASYVIDSNFIEGLCGLKGRPSVFNNVAKKLKWIEKIINRYS